MNWIFREKFSLWDLVIYGAVLWWLHSVGHSIGNVALAMLAWAASILIGLVLEWLTWREDQ